MTATAAVVQARLGSARLQGKVLADVGGATILEHVIRAAAAIKGVDVVVLAVPTGDEALVEAGNGMGVRVIEGPEEDVLRRYVLAAAAVDADPVLRITADCPLLDPELGGAALERTLEAGWDHHHRGGFPRGTGDVEVISRRALELADLRATDPWDREHVVPWIVRSAPAELEVHVDEVDGPLCRPDLRVCVDEASDLELVRRVVTELGAPPHAVAALIDFLDGRPDLVAINQHVQQRS